MRKLIGVIMLLTVAGCSDYACVATGEPGVKPGGYVLPYGGFVETMNAVERFECSDGKTRWMVPRVADR